MARYCSIIGLAIALLGGAVEVRALGPAAWSAPQVPHDRASRIAAAWWEADESLAARVEKTRWLALGLGASNVESPARWLIDENRATSAPEFLENARLARRLAPDLPIVHVALARALLHSGSYVAAGVSLAQALAAIPRHLEARLWVEGTLSLIVTVGLVLGSLFFIALLGLRAFPDAAHDLGDFVWPAMPGFARVALLACPGALILLLGEGWVGLSLVWFGLGFVYGPRASRVALLCAVGVLGIGLYATSERAGRILAALDADPLARAAYAVMREMDTPMDRVRLEAAARNDSMAAQAWALEARRKGDDVAARVRYEDLLRRHPGDSLALANLGNLSFERGETQEAIAFYERSLERFPRASVLFNLSQAHARAFEVVAFDRTLAQAQRLDSKRVDELSGRAEGGMVVDVPIALSAIRSRLIATAQSEALVDAVRTRFAPGWLGHGWPQGLLAFSGVALWCVVAARRFDASSRCRRCGLRICLRCDGSVWNGRVCDTCFRLFRHAERTDPGLRQRRVEQLQRRERRLARLDSWLRFVVPGWNGLALGRPVEALLACILAAIGFLSIVWVKGIFPDPLVLGWAGSLALASTGLTAFALYVALLQWEWWQSEQGPV